MSKRKFLPIKWKDGQPEFQTVTVHYRTHIADEYGEIDFAYCTTAQARAWFRGLFPDCKILNAVGKGSIITF